MLRDQNSTQTSTHMGCSHKNVAPINNKKTPNSRWNMDLQKNGKLPDDL